MSDCVVCDGRIGCEFCPRDPNGDYPARDNVDDVSGEAYVLHLAFGGIYSDVVGAAEIAAKSPCYLGHRIERVR